MYSLIEQLINQKIRLTNEFQNKKSENNVYYDDSRMFKSLLGIFFDPKKLEIQYSSTREMTLDVKNQEEGFGSSRH